MVHPLITLYPSTEEKFEDNGLGSLAEAVTCVVTEGANAEFELEMTYIRDVLPFPRTVNNLV